MQYQNNLCYIWMGILSIKLDFFSDLAKYTLTVY